MRRDGASDAQEGRGRLPQSRFHTLAHLTAQSAEACPPNLHEPALFQDATLFSDCSTPSLLPLPWITDLLFLEFSCLCHPGTFWGALASRLPQTFRSSSGPSSSS